MSYLDPRILDKFSMELQQIGYKYRNNLLEWNHVNHILENEILPTLFELIGEEFETLKKDQLKLQAKINQLSFSNNPERDRRMIELHNLGLSRAKIAKEVGMTKWGVSKALRRLGVN